MAEPRPVDELAGPDSLADKLRKRREVIEEGDPSGGQQPGNDADASVPAPEPEGDEDTINTPPAVLDRGYFIERGED